MDYLFLFSIFFVEVFQFYWVSPRMLTPNSILFMRTFEVEYWGWSFRLSVNLFRSLFRILRSNNGFWNFSGCIGLSIFTGHKDSIRHWVESFAVICLRGKQS